MAAARPVLYPALWTASRHGRTDEVRQLLAGKVDVEEKGGASECTALHAAASHDHEEVIILLLEHGADASASDNKGDAPMHAAASRAFFGHTAVLLRLSEHGADPSVKNNEGFTPLHSAVLRGHEETVLLLLEHGADEQSKAKNGQTPKDIAHYKSVYGPATPRIEAMLRAPKRGREAVRRVQCVAFAMGHHERLGAGSWVQWLDAGVVRMVMEQV